MNLISEVADHESARRASDLADSLSRLGDRLAVTAVIERDRELRKALIRDGQVSVFAMAPGWRGQVDAETLRLTPSDDAPGAIPTIEAQLERPDVRQTLAAAFERTGAREWATGVVDPLITGVGARETIAELDPWRGLLASQAFVCAIKASQLLERLRRSDLTAAGRYAHVSRSLYWNAALLMTRLQAVAAGQSPSSWTAGVADSVAWREWTPTLALTRERSVWSAAVAARAAASFGPYVIDRYARRLAQASQPFIAVDAVFGLASIALAEPDAVREVERTLRAAAAGAWSGSGDGLWRVAAIGAALRMLSAPQHADGALMSLLATKTLDAGALRSHRALTIDPFQIDAEGSMVALAVIPPALKARLVDILPDAATVRRSFDATRLRARFASLPA